MGEQVSRRASGDAAGQVARESRHAGDPRGPRAKSQGSVTKQGASNAGSGARRSFARAPQQVRIIGGAWKRTPLAVADVPGLRPTPDRVRETLFNWIAHLLPDLGAVRGLDLFAGTGALGFELASRGARRVTLVESNARALQSLHAAKAKLAANQIDIVAGDGLVFAAQWPPESFDLVFLDPPFDAGLHGAALAVTARLLAPGGLAYVEAPAPLTDGEAAQAGLAIVRSSRAGRVAFHLLRGGDCMNNRGALAASRAPGPVPPW